MFSITVLSLVTCLLFAWSSHGLHPHQTSQGHLWQQVPEYDTMYVQQVGKAASLTTDSILKCITLTALMSNENVHSVQFDADSGQCTPSTGLYRHLTPYNVTTNMFYHKRGYHMCDQTDSCVLVTPGDGTILRVQISSAVMTQAHAKQECEDKYNGMLYTMKTYGRQSMLQNVLTTLGVQVHEVLWVGIEDLYANSTFYWSDGEECNSAKGTFPWDHGQPDLPDQHCGVLGEWSGHKLHDDNCTHEWRYVCETQL